MTCEFSVPPLRPVGDSDFQNHSGRRNAGVWQAAPGGQFARGRCQGGRQRTYLSSRGLIDAVKGYLANKLAHGIATELETTRYRGLLQHQPLTYSGRGAALSQNTKRRVLVTGESRDHKACDSLQSHVTKLYKRVGING